MIILQSCFASNSHSFLVIFTAIKISNKRTPRFRFTLMLCPSIILDFRLTQTVDCAARVKRCYKRAPFPIPGKGIILYNMLLCNSTNFSVHPRRLFLRSKCSSKVVLNDGIRFSWQTSELTMPEACHLSLYMGMVLCGTL